MNNLESPDDLREKLRKHTSPVGFASQANPTALMFVTAIFFILCSLISLFLASTDNIISRMLPMISVRPQIETRGGVNRSTSTYMTPEEVKLDFTNVTVNREIVFEIERQGISEIIVLDVREKAVRYISEPDITSFKPLLSPDGTKVAFFYVNDSGDLNLSVRSLTSNSEDSELVEFLQEEIKQSHEFCDYTVAWSPSSEKLAAFLCEKSTHLSYLYVFDLYNSNSFLLDDTEDLSQYRSVAWISSVDIVFTKAAWIYMLRLSDSISSNSDMSLPEPLYPLSP